MRENEENFDQTTTKTNTLHRLNEGEQSSQLRADGGKARSKKSKTRVFSIFFVSLLGLLLLSTTIWARLGTVDAETEFGEELGFLASVRSLIGGESVLNQGENEHKINVVLLGIGGEGHDGPELTDTIILASFDTKTEIASMISVPRDLAVVEKNGNWVKINHINAYAEQAQAGSGPKATAAAVSDIFGQQIDHTVKIDFSGFAKMIDILGGVDLNVPEGFVDSTYPLDDGLGGVKEVAFTEGWNKMTGETALIYSRSRHGTNGQGSDFARAARQQAVLLAVKNKAFSAGVLLNPIKVKNLLQTIGAHLETDLTAWEMVKYAKFLPDFSADNLTTTVIDNRSGLVYESNLNGAYVLLPFKRDWSDFKELAARIFEGNTASTQATGGPNLGELTVAVELQNGTAVTGLAGRLGQLLESSGIAVAHVSNSVEKRADTVIYDLTDGAKAPALTAIRDFLQADLAMTKNGYLSAQSLAPEIIYTTPPPGEYLSGEARVDFLIILGEDLERLVIL